MFNIFLYAVRKRRMHAPLLRTRMRGEAGTVAGAIVGVRGRPPHAHTSPTTPTTAATPMPIPADTIAVAAANCRMWVSVVLVGVALC